MLSIAIKIYIIACAFYLLIRCFSVTNNFIMKLEKPVIFTLAPLIMIFVFEGNEPVFQIGWVIGWVSCAWAMYLYDKVENFFKQG